MEFEKPIVEMEKAVEKLKNISNENKGIFLLIGRIGAETF